MKKALLLGARGLIGRAVFDAIKDRCDAVRASRSATGSPGWIRADLTEPSTFPKCGFDIVIDCAGLIDGAPAELAKTNCQGLANMAQWALDSGCPRYVWLSSIRAVGKPRFSPIDEGHPAKPENAYQATKLFGENLLLSPEFAPLSPVILRVPAPLGPGMNPASIIPFFLRRAVAGEPIAVYGNGSRVQNYMDVEDIARAVALACDTDSPGLYNLAGAFVANSEAAALCREAAGSQSPIEFADRLDPEEGDDWTTSGEKIRRRMGFEPRISFADSLKKLLNSMSCA